MRNSQILTTSSLLLLLGAPGMGGGQERSMEQDPSLNNLVHEEGYETIPLGRFGQVEHRDGGDGDGVIPMVLVPGGGFGWQVFEDFMKANEGQYDLYAVSLAGMGGTPAPPMPPEGTSYGEQTWIRGGLSALVELIENEKLDRPVVVGHFMEGSQIAILAAIEHPELIRGAVLLGGTIKMQRAESEQYRLEERIRYLDNQMAPQWFKTVTLKTWNDNNFPPRTYSRDPERGRELFDQVSHGPLPVFVRYLVEFWAADLTLAFDRVRAPVLVLTPDFEEDMLASEATSWLPYYFEAPWEGIAGNDRFRRVTIEDAHIFVWLDQPERVQGEIEAFLRSIDSARN